jgi:hypothetical protein
MVDEVALPTAAAEEPAELREEMEERAEAALTLTTEAPLANAAEAAAGRPV